jgi:hypothetical protein
MHPVLRLENLSTLPADLRVNACFLDPHYLTLIGCPSGWETDF